MCISFIAFGWGKLKLEKKNTKRSAIFPFVNGQNSTIVEVTPPKFKFDLYVVVISIVFIFITFGWGNSKRTETNFGGYIRSRVKGIKIHKKSFSVKFYPKVKTYLTMSKLSSTLLIFEYFQSFKCLNDDLLKPSIFNLKIY